MTGRAVLRHHRKNGQGRQRRINRSCSCQTRSRCSGPVSGVTCCRTCCINFFHSSSFLHETHIRLSKPEDEMRCHTPHWWLLSDENEQSIWGNSRALVTLQCHEKSIHALPPVFRPKVSGPKSTNVTYEGKNDHMPQKRIYILEDPSSATWLGRHRRPLADDLGVRYDGGRLKSCAVSSTSRIVFMDQTSFRWMTVRHDIRSSSQAW
jgi:hypothetical protein